MNSISLLSEQAEGQGIHKQAGMMNRKQEPQLVSDPNRVLVGR